VSLDVLIEKDKKDQDQREHLIVVMNFISIKRAMLIPVNPKHIQWLTIFLEQRVLLQ